jgi:hypothetical protein
MDLQQKVISAARLALSVSQEVRKFSHRREAAFHPAEVLMFGSYILDVAIGLVFVYMLLSLLCSTINEQVITRILALRAKTLEAGIQNMLADPQGVLTKQVYGNSLIKGLTQNALSEKPS